ncbi:MAG TPA: hypothetical protein PLF54_06790, partial [Deltaproteobacteria bacterium]|nr:hypothetical protein [Deltaproteobacteria bacterium]
TMTVTHQEATTVIEEAKKAKEEGKEKVILFSWSGHGLMDLVGYANFMAGKLIDYPLPEDELRESLKSIEGLPKAPMVRSGRW